MWLRHFQAHSTCVAACCLLRTFFSRFRPAFHQDNLRSHVRGVVGSSGEFNIDVDCFSARVGHRDNFG